MRLSCQSATLSTVLVYILMKDVHCKTPVVLVQKLIFYPTGPSYEQEAFLR